MPELRTQDKRDKLRLLYADCKTTGKPLRQLLIEGLRLCDDALNGPTPGTFLSGTSEGGGSVSFSTLNGFSPIEAKRLLGELCDCYDAAVVKTQVVETNDDTNDAVIYAQMMTFLKAIRRYRNDYTGLRYGIGYYLGTN